MDISLLLGPALQALQAILKHPTNSGLRSLVVDTSHAENCMVAHQKYIVGWSRRPDGKSNTRDLDDIYVPLELYEGENRREQRKGIPVDPASLSARIGSSIILGGPGAGKTTTLKRICRGLSVSEPGSADEPNCCILLRLRELEAGEGIVDRLLATLGVRVEFAEPQPASGDESTSEREKRIGREISFLRTARRATLATFLDKIQGLVLLDGLDEARLTEVVSLSREIEGLVAILQRSSIIITCRHGAYQTAISGCDVYSMRTFDQEQIKRFTRQWFGNDEKAVAFCNCVASKSYRELAQVPLHLVNLCSIYSLNDDLPKAPYRVYEQIVDVRLRGWDEERGIVRKSFCEDLTPDARRRLLASIAFNMAIEEQAIVFTVDRFARALGASRESELAAGGDVRRLLNELESHTGLVYAAGFDRFEFVHKTIQEYLFGLHLANLPLIPRFYGMLKNMPDGCAIATLLSGSPDCFLWSLWSTLFLRKQADEGEVGSQTTLLFWGRYLGRLCDEAALFDGYDELAVGLLGILDSCILLHRKSRQITHEGVAHVVASAQRLAETAPVRDALQNVLSLGILADQPGIQCAEADWLYVDFSNAESRSQETSGFVVSPLVGRVAHPARMAVLKQWTSQFGCRTVRVEVVRLPGTRPRQNSKDE